MDSLPIESKTLPHTSLQICSFSIQAKFICLFFCTTRAAYPTHLLSHAVAPLYYLMKSTNYYVLSCVTFHVLW